MIGDLAVLTGEIRSATVQVSSEECRLLRIPAATFTELFVASPALRRSIVERLGNQVAGISAELSELGSGTRAASPSSSQLSSSRTNAARSLYVRLIGKQFRRPEFVVFLSFTTSAGLVRMVTENSTVIGMDPLFLKACYLGGLALFMASAFALLLTTVPRARILSAAGIGLGIGLVINEISLLLAFDSLHVSATPGAAFKLDDLYARSESIYAGILIASALSASVFLRGIVNLVLVLAGLLFRRACRRWREAESVSVVE